MKRSKQWLGGAGLLSVVVAGLAVTACDPVPRRTLNTEEKRADLGWVFSQFGQYYAPLSYKAERYQFDYEALKRKYEALSDQATTNEQFYDVLFGVISEFKDAHTSGSLTNSDLPGRAKIAYLGFTGERVGNEFVVKEMFPGTRASNLPIGPGTVISKIDGVAVAEAVRTQMVKYRDLGQDDANLTFHMNRLFTRVSTSNGLPTKDTVTLTLKSGAQETDLTVPWTVKDLVSFREQMAKASGESAKTAAASTVSFVGDDGKNLMLAFRGFDGKLQFPGELQKIIRRGAGFDVRNTFRFVDAIAGWTSKFKTDANGNPLASDASPADRLKAERNVPSGAIFITEAQTYPAYVYKSGGKLLGYIYVDSFSNGMGVLPEFQATLEAFQTLGVKDVIIDMINNGGGSLTLGMAMAQALSNQKITMPDIQFALSDVWMDEFEKESQTAASDIERETYRRTVDQLTSEKKAGKRLSSRFSSEIFMPYALQANTSLEKKFNVALLTNEMCASMCDIFTAILKDNGMAKSVGSRTMGAGGNVVEHTQAPNSHLDLRQTESLILRKDGSYIENNGVEVDVAMDTTLYVENKYDDVRFKAEELLTGTAVAASAKTDSKSGSAAK